MAAVFCADHGLDRQRRTVLTTRTPDDVDELAVTLFHEAGAERNVAMLSFARQIGHGPRDSCAVCRACHSPMLAQLVAFFCSPAHSGSKRRPLCRSIVALQPLNAVSTRLRWPCKCGHRGRPERRCSPGPPGAVQDQPRRRRHRQEGQGDPHLPEGHQSGPRLDEIDTHFAAQRSNGSRSRRKSWAPALRTVPATSRSVCSPTHALRRSRIDLLIRNAVTELPNPTKMRALRAATNRGESVQARTLPDELCRRALLDVSPICFGRGRRRSREHFAVRSVDESCRERAALVRPGKAFEIETVAVAGW
jgi:hypothetical protein